MKADARMSQSAEPVAVSDLRRFLTQCHERIEAMRSDADRRRVAFAAALVGGLFLAWLHWTGLVIAGALIGLTRQRLLTAILAAFGFGLVSVGLTVAVLPVISVVEFTALTPLNYATLMTGVLLPVWGSLTRYVV